MGLDGFSMGVLGLNTEMTSAQMANQAEQMAQKESQFKIKNINESAEKNGVKEKTDEQREEQNSPERQSKEDRQKSQEEEIKQILEDANFIDRDPKEFSVRVNNETEMVELFNNKDRKIVETISAKDLMGLLSKLDSASGILVNRKI